jgi:histidyl-tRNA synthetase
MADHLKDANVPAQFVDFDFTMVRGLGYYTGPIFETVITEPNLGSISGGGRYDGLIGLFRKESLPTTGVSLGIERIIDLMDLFELYPAHLSGTVVEALVTVFDAATRSYATGIAADLREAGICTELFLQDKKIGQQFKHADRKGIPFVLIAGPDEVAAGAVKIKRLSDGSEHTVPRADVAARLAALKG